MEATVELVLPLLGKAARAHDKAPLKIAARDQLLHEQARHDRFAGAGIIREQEPQWLTRQHRLVNGSDLMRQRLDDRRMNRQHRIEKMREANAMRLGDEPEQVAVAVEAPGAPLFNDLDARLVVAIEQLVRDLAFGVFVGEFEGLRAVPLRVDDGDQTIWQDALDRGIGSKVFELAHIDRSASVGG